MMKKYLALIFPLIFLSSISLVSAEQNIEIELLYPNGDRATVNNAELVIESVDGTIQKILSGDNSEHSFLATVDTSKDYRMKVFMHDMLVSTKMVYTDDFEDKVITINIPTSVGVKFIINYKDGKPITDATVDLYSHNNKLIRSSNTDSKGQTLRFWISPTEHENNYYVPVVSINDEIEYTHQNLRLVSGSTDVEIVTPWPSSVDYLDITAKKDDTTTMNSWGDEYKASLSSDVFEQTTFFNKGKAHFSNLPLGTFNLVIFEKDKPNVIWTNQTVYLTSNSNNLDVLVSNPKTDGMTSTPIYTTSADNENSIVTHDFSFQKQTSSGTQTFDSTKPYLKLQTDGDNEPVFSRSSKITQDLLNDDFMVEISVTNSQNIEELWFSFTSDGFESGWYTYSVPNSLISTIPTKLTITSDDLEQTGAQTISSIDKMQVRIRDDGIKPVTLEIYDFKFGDDKQLTESCNCVAFRLDDIQDFFLTDIQMEIVETFQKNDVDLTVGVIANNIGRDIEMTEFVSGMADDSNIEFANHGWDHEDFSQFGSVGQEMLLLRANDKISEMFGVTPTVFIPPLNAYNSDTISALHAQGFTHFSSELDFATPPFPLSDQTLYHFPETAFTGDLNEQRTRFIGMSADYTFKQIKDSLSEHGFAVVTLHPQEFAQYYNNQYQDKVNRQQIEQLELLFTKLAENNIDTVIISEINTEPNTQQLVPQWVKNNAEWWIDERVSTDEFVNSLEFLIDQKIITVSNTESASNLTDIPDWVKTNIQWWTEGQTSDSEFISATEFLIRNGIIQI